MSSSDDEVPSPQLGASSSKDRPPVTPIGFESDGDDVGKKKAPRYKRPRGNWERVLSITKGPDAEMDDDQRNARILDGARAFMESSKLYKLPGHKPNATDLGMWKLVKQWPADEGQSMVSVYRCPLSSGNLDPRIYKDKYKDIL